MAYGLKVAFEQRIERLKWLCKRGGGVGFRERKQMDFICCTSPICILGQRVARMNLGQIACVKE